jgi:hypothetical protein
MSNILLRELPPVTLDTFKTAAAANGRSLNAELVHLLNEEAARIRQAQDFLANVKPRKLGNQVDLEAIIREDREARTMDLP